MFISYAHADGAEMASRLAEDLQSDGHEVWWDKERLKPGASWTSGIEDGIDHADVVLALLSRSSYDSDICRAEQLRALRKRKRVLPVVLQPDTDLPIHLESEQYLGFFATEYNHGLDQLRAAIADEKVSASLLPKYRKRYSTYQPLPQHFVSRPELLADLRRQIIKEGEGRCVAITAIRGMGGVGKTVLAQAICHDEAVQDAFPDGVLWTTIGEKPSHDQLRDQIRELAKALGENLDGYDSLYGCENQLRTALRNKSVLIVLDDVWDPRDVRRFFADAPRCRLLITTRSQEVVRGTDAYELAVNVMEPEESLQLLARKSGLNIADLPSEAAEIIRECGSLPLALSMLGARAGKLKSEWTRVLRSLKEGRAHSMSLKLADYRYSDLFEAIQVSVLSLKPGDQSRYFDLAVFRPDTPIPGAVLRTFWDTDELDADDTVASWVAASLANRDDDGQITLHDLQMDYVRKESREDIKVLHAKLLSAYKATRRNGWESGPHDGYYFRWLAYHMREAGELQELRRLLLNPQWIRARLQDQNLSGLIDDFEFVSFDPDLKLIQQALQLSFNVLTRDPRQLAGQLFGRLRSIANPEIQRFLAAIRNSQTGAWIEPMWASLWKPGTLLLFTLAGHSQAVNAVAVVPGGKRAVSASSDATLKVWDIEYGHKVHTLKGHSDSVSAVAVTPDGLRAVSGSRDSTVMVWNIESGSPIYTLRGHSAEVSWVAVTADGKLAISASDDNSIKVWSLETGEEVHTLTGHTRSINALTCQGEWIISASDDHTVRIWEASSGKQAHLLSGHSGPVNVLALTPDGRRIVSGSNDANLIIWDLKSGAKLRTLSGHSSWVDGIAIAPDGRRLVSASYDTTLKIWDIETGQEIHTLSGHSHRVNAVAITRDGSRVISASPDNTVKIWDLARGAELRSLTAHSGSVKAVLITPDGARAISFSDDSTVRVWRTGTELRDQDGHSHMVTGLATANAGKSAVSASYDRTLKLWDLETGSQVCTFTGHSGPVISVTVSPDGHRALSASEDNTLKLWDLGNATELHTLAGHAAPVIDVAFTSDGNKAVSTAYDKTVIVWDLQNGTKLHTLSGHGGPAVFVVTPAGVEVLDMHTATEFPMIGRSLSVAHVAVTPDDRQAISACCDKTLKVWDIATGTELRSLAGHTGWVSAVAVTNDGSKTVSGSFDKTIKVWDLQTGVEQSTLRGHALAVSHLVTSPGGDQLLSTSQDCTLKLWNMESATLINSMEGHSAPVNAIAMTSDGRRMLSVSDDHTLRVWGQSGEEIAAFSADGSILCLAACKDEGMSVAGDFLGHVHLLWLHEESRTGFHHEHPV